MATIIYRNGLGRPLTNDEVDQNFENLDTDKLEAADLSVTQNSASGTGALTYTGGVFTYTPPDLSSYVVDLSSFTTTNLAEGTNLYYTNERVDDRVNTLIQAGLGITTSYDDINNELTIESDTIEELCKNGTGSTILKGTPVYQTGTAGNAMVIAPADASSAATMPAVGVLSQDLAAAAEGNLILMGRISGVNTSAFSEGDVIYVASGGGYTNVRPTGQSVLVQNLGRVTKVDASNGGGVVMGSGRANDVPNLTNGNVFIGNAGGTYDKRAIVTTDISDLTATATELNYTDGVTSNIQTQLNSKLPSSSYTAADVLTKVKTVDGTGSGLDADLLDGQHGSYYTGYTDTAIANLVDSAPATLDTLNELAAALGDDPNFATTVTNSIATKVSKSGDTITSGTNTGLTINHNTFAAGLVIERNDALNSPSITFKNTASQSGILYAPIADNSLRWRDGTSTNSSIIWHQGNDGAGSGLDADLLDGQHGSYYAAASSLSNYLPLTGGTLSGDVVTSGDLVAGSGSGNVALTANDGHGNANVTFNHRNGDAEQAGNVGRIEVNVDSTSGATMSFEVRNNSSTGPITINYNGMTLTQNSLTINNSGTSGGGTLNAGTVNATTFSGALSGNATTATTLQTARTINGVSFDGSSNITVADSTKLPLAGGTLSGSLYLVDTNTGISEGSGNSVRITTNSGWVDVGAQNTSYAHFQTDRSKFYFNKDAHFDGQLYNYVGGGTTDPYWRAGNDGAGSGLDADLLDGQEGSYYYSPTNLPEITEVNDLARTKARQMGWVPAYSNSTESSVVWSADEDAVALTAGSGGAAFKAIRMKSGDTVRIQLQIKGSTADTDGLYVRIYFYNGDLPDGKTHVSNSATYSLVQEDSSGDTGWYENNAISTSWVGFERTYTASADGYMSVVVLNWSGYSGTLYMKQPDIQFQNVYSATSADTLTTARTINGVSFDGSANITIADDTKLPLSGGTLTGDLSVNGGQVYTSTVPARVKFAVWSNDTYGIGMQNSYTFGGLTNDYAMTFQMSDTATRGFWWGDSTHTNAQGAMALTTGGLLTVSNGMRLGYGGSDTTTPTAGQLDVNGTVNAVTSMSAPIFYDSDNPAYYLNPASTSVLNNIQIASYIYHYGDTNSYLGFSAADDFRIFVGGRQILRCDEGADPDKIQFFDANHYIDTNGTFAANNINEDVYNLTGTALTAVNGGIQYKTLAANTTFTDSMVEGSSMTLRLGGGATYTVTWPTVTWITSGGNVAPTLNGTNDVLVFWKEGSVLYGAYAGYGA